MSGDSSRQGDVSRELAVDDEPPGDWIDLNGGGEKSHPVKKKLSKLGTAPEDEIDQLLNCSKM